MSEIDQLKARIDASGNEGIETAIVRDDYEPAGNLMMHSLMESGEYVQYKTPAHSFDAKWRIFKKGNEPY
jgi:hypothetical protein